jgi:hypothetical protein
MIRRFMGFEIEKKFLVGNYNDTLALLKKDFGKNSSKSKAGFWFASNYTGTEIMTDLPEPKFLKKELAMIRDIGEFEIPLQDFQFLRLRIINKDRYVITFKSKSIVNKIEQNIEYEYECKKNVFTRILNFLNEGSLIFYYNIKESLEFKSEEMSIELSKFNDLKDSYIEIEVTGDNENQLTAKLEKHLKNFEKYSLREEPKNYSELSYMENRKTLKNMKISQYSKEAVREINNKIKNNKN